ncbi:right-handed parallel beta-helix repeat-containing protein [Pseudonocardia sp. KRD291]|uniref:right-handed parallel beta-helix repeat-containing protein n=1 Tax=Pseudonocardia sp. KRD291 TaxID=2792007 RepID=UPI001C4A6246|nr:right-handed parallel beta-helix repeat-containing protein [Pseudonocardia sp. KRD291]MBW0101550.1 right-handed parallel beta-helix repeat-containing protein [Pseudonocardia sp. KRD291]
MTPRASGRGRSLLAPAIIVSVAALSALQVSGPVDPPYRAAASSVANPPPYPGAALPVLTVSPTGDDDGPGTSAAPLRTIEAAAEAAVPGTTVVVAPGTYAGSFRTGRSGRPDARVTYVSEVRWGAKLVGDGEDEQVWRNDGDHVDIRGFDISGTNVDGLLDTGSFVRMVGNHVHGFRAGTCLSTYKVDYALRDIDVIGNVVHGCGDSSLDHGIYPGHPGGRVLNNISYGNAGFGIHCWHNCNSLVIANNLVFDNDEGGILIGQGDGPNYGDVAAGDMVVSNNIAVFNGAYGIRESGATAASNRYLHNNVHANAEGGFSLRAGAETGTVTAEPGFRDFRIDGAGDYHLRADSPNVDTGTSVGAPAEDVEEAPRPQGAGFDIGVYERAP